MGPWRQLIHTVGLWPGCVDRRTRFMPVVAQRDPKGMLCITQCRTSRAGGEIFKQTWGTNPYSRPIPNEDAAEFKTASNAPEAASEEAAWGNSILW